jgi:sarcosine oxidase subunit beta
MASPDTADVVVVGAGVIGTAVTYYLAKTGTRVVCVERSHVAAGSSGACDGFMFVQSKKPGPNLTLAMESVDIYRGLREELLLDIEYRQPGGMILIGTPESWDSMVKFTRLQREAGLDVQLLDSKQTLELEPQLSPEILGCAYSPLDGQIDPIGLANAFAATAKANGAELRLGTEVLAVETDEHGVSGVLTSGGRLSTRAVVVACGVATPHLLKGLGLTVPIKPRKGCTIVTEALPPVVNHVFLDAQYIAVKLNPAASTTTIDGVGYGFSLEQTKKGNVLLGNTRSFSGYDVEVDPRVLFRIRAYASRYMTFLDRVAFIRSFAGLRPYVPDGLPLLGPVSGYPGLFLAAGHEGDGVALAAITGRLISENVVTGRVPELMALCLPDRFELKSQEPTGEPPPGGWTA